MLNLDIGQRHNLIVLTQNINAQWLHVDVLCRYVLSRKLMVMPEAIMIYIRSALMSASANVAKRSAAASVSCGRATSNSLTFTAFFCK